MDSLDHDDGPHQGNKDDLTTSAAQVGRMLYQQPTLGRASALERVDEPEHWLRREIETALDYRRNIVPLLELERDRALPVGG